MSDLDFSDIEITDEPTFSKPDHKASEEKKKFNNPFVKRDKPSPSERRSKPKKTAPNYPKEGYTKALEELYASIGALLLPFDQSCGIAVIEAAPECAKTLDELSKNNPTLRRIIVGIMTTNAWGAVIMAHTPIIMAIVSHHVIRETDSNKDDQAKIVDFVAKQRMNHNGHNGDSA